MHCLSKRGAASPDTQRTVLLNKQKTTGTLGIPLILSSFPPALDLQAQPVTDISVPDNKLC